MFPIPFPLPVTVKIVIYSAFLLAHWKLFIRSKVVFTEDISILKRAKVFKMHIFCNILGHLMKHFMKFVFFNMHFLKTVLYGIFIFLT